MRPLLEAVAAGRAPADDLTVVYHDVQALWGGVTLTLGPGGRVERAEVGPGGQPTGATEGTVPPERVREVAALLVEVEAWAHRMPARMPVPDEALPTLTVRCGGEQATVWELGGDLEENGRLVRVRDLLENLARDAVPDT